MHDFEELVEIGAEFTLEALNEAYEETLNHVQTSAQTPFIKGLQMVRLQKAIFATGMFSIFEAELQDLLGCDNGFKEAKKILIQKGETDLAEHFNDFYLAINVLKHGKGSSYNALVAKSKHLPFRIKMPDEYFFNEGDVSEVSTLIEVDDNFVLKCAKLIRETSDIIKS